MGLEKPLLLVLLFWAFSAYLLVTVECDASEVVTVKFLKAPRAFSSRNSATFSFEVFVGDNGNQCRYCSISCKLDDLSSDCIQKEVSFTNLQDGVHMFEVCANGSQGVGCAKHNWTVDTIPPTAYVTASTSFTDAQNVSVDVSFTEPCSGGGGFGCSSGNACNLLVYGAGQVLPHTLNIVQPNLKYSLLVALNMDVQYGRVILVMDKYFCTDKAGNLFTRSTNSSSIVHFDRRSVYVNLRTHVPEKLLQLNNETRTVQATNSRKNLKVYLYFSKPILNSSSEILRTLMTSQGSLHPSDGDSLGYRRFGFWVLNISDVAVVSISIDATSIISRQGTPVSSVAPVTFLYDSQRPSVRLSTSRHMKTRERSIPVLVKFTKPVFGFNSSHVAVSGGHLRSFQEISKSIYNIEVRADNDFITISVPENVTGDVAGNTNLPSNSLQVMHYSVPLISSVISIFVTAASILTSLAAGVLTVSTASLQSIGAFSSQTYSLTADPARSLFRTLCHIQVFALSRWLTVSLPVEYYEFLRGLDWSIPYFSLPWESTQTQPIMMVPDSGDSSHSYLSRNNYPKHSSNMHSKENFDRAASGYGLPLTPMEYRSFFENQNIKPEAEYISNLHNSNGWRNFDRCMFWLGVIGGSLILLHLILLLILKVRDKASEKPKSYGAATFPRFEIFLLILALPCICFASSSLIKGSETSGVIVGILLLGIACFLLLALLVFLSVGITRGKLLQYKEVHQVGQIIHWYQDIVRVTLGPGKRGQWTWKNQPNSVWLIKLGSLFEDLRGPPKYILSQITGGNTPKRGDRIIASEDETEDAEAPFIQKLFGILRIYYTLLESVKRVCLGFFAGAYSESHFSKTPTIVLLSITSFQLFFVVLKKPFIKKKVQLVEIISLLSQVCVFGTCLILLDLQIPYRAETQIGIFMIALFMIGFIAQMINAWHALCIQVRRLDPAQKRFFTGLESVLIGLALLILPRKLFKNLDSRFSTESTVGETGEGALSGSESRSSGMADKPWLKQLRELAKSSFSREGNGFVNDPSSSNTRWSGFWGTKRSGSSSVNSSSDYKSRPRRLYRDLEAIFASK